MSDFNHQGSGFRQRVENPRPGADALVVAGEVELLVRRMHAVVVEREADQERIHAEHALEIRHNRHRAAGAVDTAYRCEPEIGGTPAG